MDILAVIGVVVVVGFIGYRVWVAKNKPTNTGVGGGGGGKYPNQDKK